MEIFSSEVSVFRVKLGDIPNSQMSSTGLLKAHKQEEEEEGQVGLVGPNLVNFLFLWVYVEFYSSCDTP